MRSHGRALTTALSLLVVADIAGGEAPADAGRKAAAAASPPPTRILPLPKEARGTGTALVRFVAGTDPKLMEERVRAAGGTPVAVLPSIHAVVMAARGEGPELLDALIAKLAAPGLVLSIVRVPFFQPHQVTLDDDLLATADSAAYRDVRLGAAASHLPPATAMRTVGVAIIDSGLDSTFGSSSEFANVRYYDLCTAAGRAGTPDRKSVV